MEAWSEVFFRGNIQFSFKKGRKRKLLQTEQKALKQIIGKAKISIKLLQIAFANP
jgi:hypothetical protein